MSELNCLGGSFIKTVKWYNLEARFPDHPTRKLAALNALGTQLTPLPRLLWYL